MKAPILLALAGLWVTTADVAEEVVTLACEGTKDAGYRTRADSTTEPISTDLIINFTTKTVMGFIDLPVAIRAIDKVSITFGDSSRTGAFTISGSIDRVSGDVEAFSSVGSGITHFLLHCEPKQRTLNPQ
jgi:hypothetical protein